jgi:hypothetical protein
MNKNQNPYWQLTSPTETQRLKESLKNNIPSQ